MLYHIKAWNKWRKQSIDGKVYKFLVLIGFMKSPSLEFLKAIGWQYEETDKNGKITYDPWIKAFKRELDKRAYEEYQDEVRKEYEYLHWDIR